MNQNNLPSIPSNPYGNYPPAQRTPMDGVFNVSPKIAEVWLELNVCNYRVWTQEKTDLWVRQIESGSWLVTHEAIGFDWNGNLFDGQHRLKAIIQTGQTVPLRVVTGITPEAAGVVDTGAKRTADDALRNGGFHNVSTIGTTARFWARRTRKRGKVTLQPNEVLELAMFMDGIGAIAQAAQAVYNAQSGVRQMQAGPICIAGYLVHTHRDAATVSEYFKFVTTVATGTELKAGSAALALFQRLARERDQARNRGRGKIGQDLLVALILSAFRAHMRGSIIKRLVIQGDETPSDLPYIDRA